MGPKEADDPNPHQKNHGIRNNHQEADEKVFGRIPFANFFILFAGLLRIDLRRAESFFLPEESIIVVFRYGFAQELLWRESWALNVIGHYVVDLSDFD